MAAGPCLAAGELKGDGSQLTTGTEAREAWRRTKGSLAEGGRAQEGALKLNGHRGVGETGPARVRLYTVRVMT